MSIRPRHHLLAVAAALALTPAWAQNAPIIGYWLDASGRIVKNSWGECWRTGSWTPALALPECEGGAKAEAPAAPQPQPAPAPTPAPAPAPVAAPAAQPPAAAAPAPQPAPTYRTQVTEQLVRLDGAHFATGSSKLLPDAGKRLNEVVAAARQHPDARFSVTGHTDSTGSAALNQKLSQARAEAVKAYLVSQGVAASRIDTAGKGASEPIADNRTAQGRAQNRRVEIRYTVREETRVRVQ